MKIQLLNSFKGDDVREIDTSTPEGRGSAAKLISDLIRTGSALFLEKDINGTTYTYRVTGYDEARDKIKLSVMPREAVPAELEAEPIHHKRGRYKTRSEMKRESQILVNSDAGDLVSVAPVAGGMDLEPATIECEEGSEKATVTVDGETREVTWEGVRYAMERLCEERGWHHGIPMPSATDWGHRFIMAKGSPMAIEHEAPQCFGPEETPILDAVEFVNAWTPRARTVHFYRDSKGTMAAEVPTAELRLRTLLDSLIVRAGAVDWRAELKAMLSLRVKINESQWESYLLSGAFPETSKRSGVMYIFRKCFPTIALREIRLPDGKSKRAFLAALCCHGLGYYEHTFAGCQPPTDDVMGHLMLMRADEHRFWKRSGQHSLESVMAGI